MHATGQMLDQRSSAAAHRRGRNVTLRPGIATFHSRMRSGASGEARLERIDPGVHIAEELAERAAIHCRAKPAPARTAQVGRAVPSIHDRQATPPPRVRLVALSTLAAQY